MDAINKMTWKHSFTVASSSMLVLLSCLVAGCSPSPLEIEGERLAKAMIEMSKQGTEEVSLKQFADTICLLPERSYAPTYVDTLFPDFKIEHVKTFGDKGTWFIVAADEKSKIARVYPASESGRQGDRVMHAEDTRTKRDSGHACAIRFAALIHDLDAVLASGPPSVLPIQALFEKYFPLENCNIAEVIEIARKSRFLVGVADEGAYYNMSFDSAAVGSGFGFAVLLSLRKATAAFELPFVKVNRF